MKNMTKKSLIFIAMVSVLSTLGAESFHQDNVKSVQDLQYEVKKVQNLHKLKVVTPILLAKPFHQFKVKSGKIVYEHKKFKTKMSFKYINGKEESTREVIPYVDTRETYYWDNYGDVVFREVYQVSKFGGKLLPQPVKKFEQLFKGDKRYYYNAKKKKASYDPWYEKNQCLKKTASLDDRGCFAVFYPKMKHKGEEVVAGKRTEVYREDIGTDLYLWKGLNLKEQNFAFNPQETKRLNIENEMLAIEVDTNASIDPKIFNPQWLDQFNQ